MNIWENYSKMDQVKFVVKASDQVKASDMVCNAEMFEQVSIKMSVLQSLPFFLKSLFLRIL